MTNQLKADVGMLLVTLFWGSSYLFMKLGLADMHPLNLIALRFGIAFLVAGTAFHKRLFQIDKSTLGRGIILGIVLFFVFVAVTYGVQHTSAPHAGFLVSLAVVFVPILASTVTKQKIQRNVLVAIGIAILGVGLLTLNDHFSMNLGDVLCLSGAFLYAIHIIVTDAFAKRGDPITLGTMQLGVAGVLGLIVSGFLGNAQLPNTEDAWIAVLALSILCSAFGFIVQTVTQKHTLPTHTGLIFSLEPVFTVIFAYLLTGETLSPRGLVGASLMLLSILFAEFGPQKSGGRDITRNENVS